MDDETTENIVKHSPTLSREQKEAIVSGSKHIRIIAGAGTGKTETLTRRIVYLLLHEKVSPEEIVAFTFTDKAAQSMKSRIYNEVEKLGGKEACLRLGEMYVGTIHGFCLRVLEKSIEYGDYEVFDENQEMAFLLRRGWDIGIPREKYFDSCDRFLRSMNVVYDEFLDTEKVEEKSPEFSKRMKTYEEMLRKNKRLSFGQLVYLAVKKIESRPELVENIRHLIVDEYQDINRTQEKLVGLIGRSAGVFIVGDPRQTIYRWRGSNEELFEDFSRIFQDVDNHSLRENRRSSASVIMVANKIAEKMLRNEEHLESMREEKGLAGLVDFGSREEEAIWIADRIKQIVEEHKLADYSDIAVLVRSVKMSGEPFIKAFREREIPFVIGGNSGLFQRDEVQAVARLFAWLSYKGFWRVGHGYTMAELRDTKLFESALERWKKATGISLNGEQLAALKQWKKKVENDGFHTLIETYYELLLILGYRGLNPSDKVTATVMSNLGRFSSLLSDYDVSISFGGARGDIKSYLYNLCLFMNSYASVSYDEEEGYTENEVDAVHLMTIHQAKGLEWSTVFIPSFMEGKLPMSRVGKEQQWDISEKLFERGRYEGEENDERRLAYVAVTRAKDNVIFSYYTDRQNDKPSRFLSEIKDSLQLFRTIDKIPLTGARRRRDEETVNTFTTGEIVEYFRCPYFYRFRNVWGYKPEIVQPMGYGRSLHHCLRLLADTEAGEITPDRIKSTVRGNFHLPFAPEKLSDKLEKKAESTLQEFIKQNYADMLNIDSVEVRVEFPLKKSTVVGKADVIINDATRGGIEVRDYKTSDKVITKGESDLQVRLYSIGFEAIGEKVVLGSVANLEENEVRDLSVRGEDLDSAKKIAENAIDGILERDFPAVPAEHCRQCDFKDICTQGYRYLESNPVTKK